MKYRRKKEGSGERRSVGQENMTGERKKSRGTANKKRKRKRQAKRGFGRSGGKRKSEIRIQKDEETKGEL